MMKRMILDRELLAKMDQETFYKNCFMIFSNGNQSYFHVNKHGIKEEIVFSYIDPTDVSRWGPRIPGNGRYKGYGVVRHHGMGPIHVMLRDPRTFRTDLVELKDEHPTCMTFNTEEDVFNYLRKVMSTVE